MGLAVLHFQLAADWSLRCRGRAMIFERKPKPETTRQRELKRTKDTINVAASNGKVKVSLEVKGSK